MQQDFLDLVVVTSLLIFVQLRAQGGLRHSCKHHSSQEDVLSLHTPEPSNYEQEISHMRYLSYRLLRKQGAETNKYLYEETDRYLQDYSLSCLDISRIKSINIPKSSHNMC